MDYAKILSIPIAIFREEPLWMAEGDDIALYEANKSTIKNLLGRSGIPESNQGLWIGVYRIGKKQDQARPVIVVSCLDPKLRKRVKCSIKSCCMFQKGGVFAHFTVLGKATPPEPPCEPQLTMAGDAQANGRGVCLPSIPCIDQKSHSMGQEIAQSQVFLHIFGSHTGDSYLCRPIQARRGLQTQSTTAGPLLFWDGNSYQLTVEHVVDFDRRRSRPTWEHTNDDWDDEDDDDDVNEAGGYGYVEDMVPSDFGAVLTISEGSLSSRDVGIGLYGSSSSSSAQELEGNTLWWSPTEPALTPHPQSHSGPGKVHHVAVEDHSSSSQIGPNSSPTRCYISAKTDYLLFPIHASPNPELYTTRGAERVQLSDIFDVHRQTRARPVIIATASLGYVRGIIFPASTLLQKPGSHDFQTLFCIESVLPMPKGTSGSAVFDAQTGLLAGYLVLGCPGKRTCYMVPMCDVLAELNMLCSSSVQCQVRLDVSAIVEMSPENSVMTRLSFHPCVGDRSIPRSPVVPREEAIRCNNRPILDRPLVHAPGLPLDSAGHVERNSLKSRPFQYYVTHLTSDTLEWFSWNQQDEWERLSQTAKVSVSVENRPFIDIIMEVLPEASEIPIFFLPRMSSARWERRVLYIEKFCAGAPFAINGPVLGDAEDPMFKNIQEPKAWVSDRNFAHEGFPPPQRVRGRVLGPTAFYEVLQKKVFPP